MGLLINKDIRLFFGQVLAVVILSLLFGVVFSQKIVQDFKEQILTHDYEVAGYMLEHGATPADVSMAFAAEKSEREISSGKRLLQTLGYRLDADNRLLPDANALLHRYRLILTLFALLLGLLLCTAFFFYFKRQQQVIEKASNSIDAFMGGRPAVRIDSEKEGSLSRLFASVSTMATSLNAHIEAEKRNKDFLKNTISDISHQLKTPLAALKMYNEIVQEESANEETVKKFTVKTESALEHMEILIQNLLKITKLDAGTIAFNKKNENLPALIEKIVSAFETRAIREQKSITCKGPADAVLYCDGDWMAEAIGNLVKNALDHMRAGGQVEIRWEETPVITKIIVKDDGPGIHPKDLHHVFKRFYRSRFSQDTRGIGLGLSLTRSIVEAHNGAITADSSLGQGSLFALDFLKLTNL